MKKFLLVAMIGMVFTIYLCGIIKHFTTEELKEVNHIEETTITVYVE